MKHLIVAVAAGGVLCACAQVTQRDHVTTTDAGAATSRNDSSTIEVATPGDGGSIRGATTLSRDLEVDADSGSELSTNELCDGTDAVRLLYEVYGGGTTTPTIEFSSVYGSTFLVIDGSCHFYVSDLAAHGVRTGTLNNADAAQLSADLAWSELEEWRDYGTRNDQACPDAPITVLVKRDVALGCSCGCDPTAPAGLADAQQNASLWVERLWQRGDELTTAISAVAVPGARSKSHYQPWPLTRSMQSIPDLILTSNTQQMSELPFARFDNSVEAMALRKLRSDAFARDPQHALVIRVNESDAKYDLFVRDELPEDTARELSKLKSSLGSTKVR